jgi:16S rRNA (guanine527-N7)-methyltransferase
MNEQKLYDVIKEITGECSEQTIQKLEKYYEMVVEKNKVMNLTGITEYQEFYNKHFYDSICFLKYQMISGNVSDIGAGAGFPSIPLSIILPQVNFYLIEPLTKRTKFLEEVKSALALDNVTIINKRAEELSEYTDFFDFSLTRAVANNFIIEEITAPFLKIGGMMLQLKGSSMENEIFIAKRKNELGIESPKIIPYEILDGSKRNLVIVKKNAKSKQMYPRNYGMIKKEFDKLKNDLATKDK